MKLAKPNFFEKVQFLENFLENVYSIVFQNFMKIHQKLNEILQKIRKNFKRHRHILRVSSLLFSLILAGTLHTLQCYIYVPYIFLLPIFTQYHGLLS